MAQILVLAGSAEGFIFARLVRYLLFLEGNFANLGAVSGLDCLGDMLSSSSTWLGLDTAGKNVVLRQLSYGNWCFSFAGRTKTRRKSFFKERVGGFGGVGGLERYIRDNGVIAVIDSTHPFASVMTGNCYRACLGTGIPVFHFRRKPWQELELGAKVCGGDSWFGFTRLEEMMLRLGWADYKSILVTLGGSYLSVCQRFMEDLEKTRGDDYKIGGRRRPKLYFRLIDQPDVGSVERFKRLGLEFIASRGPFSLSDERELFERHEIDCLLTKNSGGSSAYQKLLAAQERGADIFMLQQERWTGGDKYAFDGDNLLAMLMVHLALQQEASKQAGNR